MVYFFGDCTLDPDRRELRRGASLVAVEPQVFDILEFLISRRDRVVTKDDLIAAVWGGRIVSESTLSSRITAVRHAVGDSGETQCLIRTIPRKGLRFVGEVREERPRSSNYTLGDENQIIKTVPEHGYPARIPISAGDVSARMQEDAAGELDLAFEDMGQQQRVERRLAAILAADIAGYSRLMGADEEGTLARLKTCRRELIYPKIKNHKGQIVKTTGDRVWVEFSSIVDAIRCATEVQAGMAERNAEVPSDKRIELRVGIHMGDVIADHGDIFGDGVNIAACLEGLAQPGSIYVSARVQEDAAGELDLAFEDMGQRQLKNIARPVRVYRVLSGASAPESHQATLPLPDKPSIAVLPFANMSGDPEQEYFADGVVEDIITALSRIKWLFVIARTSTFTYKGQAIDVKQVGRELGVRYVLEGSVRKAGSRVRITGQLIDAASGAHLWADRFDGSLEDVFELQGMIAASVAGVIEPTLIAAEILRSTVRPTNDSTAYDLYLRALSLSYTRAKETILSALGLLEQAIERDPHYGPALASAAYRHLDLHVSGWGWNPETHRNSGISFARRALGVAADDPYVVATSAYTLAYFGEDIDAALELVDRALALNPSFARGWVISGWLRLWAGQPELAISHFETSLRLSPRARTAGTYMAIGVAHFFSRRFEDARTVLLRSLQELPTWPPTYRFLASCYAHMGLLGDARETVRKLQGLTKVLVPSAEHWRNAENRELFLQGLRLAVGEAA